MSDSRWLIWVGLILLFMLFRGVRALLRGTKSASDGMTRLNAAAERILKERGAATSNPIPRTKANPMGAKPTRGQIAAAKPRNSPAVMKVGATPAVVRRGNLLGGREPVIQRRR
jgi:hypothetical protein